MTPRSPRPAVPSAEELPPERIEEAWGSLARVHDRVEDRLQTRLQSAHGLSFSEYRVLRRLAAEPECRLRMARLADEVGLTPSAASRLVARLEEGRGLLDRCLCDHDRRGVYTRLTEEGERLLEAAETTYREALRSAWSEAVEAGELEAALRAMAAEEG